MIFYCSRCARQVHERRHPGESGRGPSLLGLPLCAECAVAGRPAERPGTTLSALRRRARVSRR